MADFEQHHDALAELDMDVVALSADPADETRALIDRLRLRYPVAFGLDPEKTSRLIGCYTGVHEGQPHIQPASFILDSAGKIVLAVYSSGKVGRLTAEDAITIARDLRKQQAQGTD